MKELNAMKNKNILEVILKVIVAAIAAAPTVITTNSCMGHSPFRYELSEQTNKSKKKALKYARFFVSLQKRLT